MSAARELPESSGDPASLWAARLDGAGLSARERAELDAWLAGDPERRVRLAEYCQLSVDLGRLLPELAAAGRVEAPAEKAGPAVRWRPRWALASALVAVALAGAWLGWPVAKPETFAAPAGKTRTFMLADGSKVELNANTSLIVENGRSERRVLLADGEAFFEVSKDKSRPFVVETPAGSVRVTGTRFDVRTEAASELEVTVVEGTVQVRPSEGSGGASGGARELRRGDRLVARDGGVGVKALSAAFLDDALAWRDGQVVFDATPLAEVLSRVAHYHGRGDFTASRGAAVKAINGRIRIDDLDEFFSDLEQIDTTLRVVRDSGGGAHVSLRAEN